MSDCIDFAGEKLPIERDGETLTLRFQGRVIAQGSDREALDQEFEEFKKSLQRGTKKDEGNAFMKGGSW